VAAIKFLHHIMAASHGGSEDVDQWSAVANKIEAEANLPKSPELRKFELNARKARRSRDAPGG